VSWKIGKLERLDILTSGASQTSNYSCVHGNPGFLKVEEPKYFNMCFLLAMMIFFFKFSFFFLSPSQEIINRPELEKSTFSNVQSKTLNPNALTLDSLDLTPAPG